MKQIKKNVLQKEIKDLTLEVSDSFTHFLKIFSCKGPSIYDVHKAKGWGGLENCYMLTDYIVFKQQIYYSFLQKGVAGDGLWASQFYDP